MLKLNEIRPVWKRCIKAGMILAIVAGLTACSLFPPEENPLPPPLVEPVKITDTVEEVKTGSIQLTLTGPATLESTRQAYHQLTESGGRIREILVRSGDTVEAGDVLILLEDEGLDIELMKREIELEQKRIELKEALQSEDGDWIRIATMEMRLAEKLVEQAKAKLEATRVRAQISGIVTFVASIKPGDYVDAYRPLVIVSDPKEMWLVYSGSVHSPNLNAVQVGMHVDLVYKGKELTGKVVQTPRSAPYTEDERLREEYSRTLYIEVDDLPEEAAPGQQMNVSIVLAEKEDVIVIPKSALRSVFGRTFVQVLEGEKRREVDVEVGIETATEVEIVAGLEPGQTIVLK